MKRSLAVAALSLACVMGAQAQSVALAGRMGDRALLVVNGMPYTVAVGSAGGGVKLLRWLGEDAEVDIANSRVRLRLGGTPAQLGAGPVVPAREIVMAAGQGGHFTPEGTINGRSVRFMVDTGATLVAIGQDEAARLGLDLSNASKGISHTANGPVTVQIVILDRIRVGSVEITNVGAAIVPQALPFVLLGNSFLSRFQMRRDNDVMQLTLK
jgi:aspartyl protease family protein